MRSTSIYFNDDDFKKLVKQKGKRSWRVFILNLAKIEQIKNEEDGGV